MAFDLASLKIEIDSKQVAAATGELNALAAAAKNAEGSVKNLGAAQRKPATKINQSLIQQSRDYQQYVAKTKAEATAQREHERRTLQFIAADKKLKLMEQARDYQQYVAKTKAEAAAQREHERRTLQFIAAEKKLKLMEQARDYQLYTAKVRAEKAAQALLEKRDMEEQKLRWAAEKQKMREQIALGNDIIAIRRRQLKQDWGTASVKDSELFSNAAAIRPQEDIYALAGVKSPTQRAAEIENTKNAMAQLRKEHSEGVVTGTVYKQTMHSLVGKLNQLEHGSARARSEFRRMAAYIASATFEITGMVYGLTAAAGILAAPALFGTQYLRKIEDAKLGIAGTLHAMQVASGVTADWANSLAISERVIKQLDAASVKYNIALEDITKTFQAIVGPGLAAGMTLKQVSSIAVSGALAVKALGLESRQAVQEVRDLVQGGVQAASSTVAVALGITDKTIKKWKELGIQYQELEKRLSGYMIAATERQNTLSGAIDILWIKIQRLFADTGGMNAFRDIINNISNSIATIDKETGEIRFNKDVVDMVKLYWEAIKAVAQVLGTVIQLTVKWSKEILLLIGAWMSFKAAALLAPKIVGAFAAIGVAIAAVKAKLALLAAAYAAAGSAATASAIAATAAMGSIYAAASVFVKRMAALSVAARGGLIGLLLFGVYVAADYLGIIDKIFGSVESRAKKFRESIAHLPVEHLEWQRGRIKEQIAVLEREINLGMPQRKIAFGKIELESKDALTQLRANLKQIEEQIKAAKVDQRPFTLQAQVQQGRSAEESQVQREFERDPVKKRQLELKKLHDEYNKIIRGIEAERELAGGKGAPKEVSAELDKRLALARARYEADRKAILNTPSKGVKSIRNNVDTRVDVADKIRAEIAAKTELNEIERINLRTEQIKIDMQRNELTDERHAELTNEIKLREALNDQIEAGIKYAYMAAAPKGTFTQTAIAKALAEFNEAVAKTEAAKAIGDERLVAARKKAEDFVATKKLEMDAIRESLDLQAKEKRESMRIMPAAEMELAKDFSQIESDRIAYIKELSKAKREGIINEEKYNSLMSDANKLYADQKVLVGELWKDQQALNASWEHGAKTALQAYADEAMNVAKNTEGVVTRAFKGMEDALVSFVKTGKLNFRELANSIIEGMIRIRVQQNITGPLAKWAEGLFTTKTVAVGATAPAVTFGIGDVPAVVGVPLHHTGGIVGSLPPSRYVHPALFADAPRYHSGGIVGDEVPIIARRGEGVFTPSQMRALGNGGNTITNNVTVTVNAGGSGSETQGDTSQAAELGRRIESAVRSVLIAEKRPGGLLRTA